jgi:hypothetical protein
MYKFGMLESQSVPAAAAVSSEGLSADPESLSAIDEDEEGDGDDGPGDGDMRRASSRVPTLNMGAVTKMNEKRAQLAAVYNQDVFHAFDSHGLVPADASFMAQLDTTRRAQLFDRIMTLDSSRVGDANDAEWDWELEAEELMSWSTALDFDNYQDSWRSLATTGMAPPAAAPRYDVMKGCGGSLWYCAVCCWVGGLGGYWCHFYFRFCGCIILQFLLGHV